MKRIVSCVLICALLVLALGSCGKTKMRVDGMTFTFAYAEKSLDIVACSAQYADRFQKTEFTEYSLAAQDGKFTFTGASSTAEGTYEIAKIGKDYVIYNVVIGEYSGVAALTEGSLLFTLGEYTVFFKN